MYMELIQNSYATHKENPPNHTEGALTPSTQLGVLCQSAEPDQSHSTSNTIGSSIDKYLEKQVFY